MYKVVVLTPPAVPNGLPPKNIKKQEIDLPTTEISSLLTASEIHKLTMKIQSMIMEKFHIVLTVGIYALDEEYRSVYNDIENIVKDIKGALGSHGYFVDPEAKLITFDCVVDFTILDKQQFCKDLIEKVKKIYPDYTVYVNLDLNYSD